MGLSKAASVKNFGHSTTRCKMGSHIIDGEFQSDKYPTCPAGKVPLSVKDKMAQDLLWEYATRRRWVDREFANDLETALRAAGYEPSKGICFECQPTAMGFTMGRPPIAPNCDKCGKPCSGGHWVIK
jgi:hypothetical protein